MIKARELRIGNWVQGHPIDIPRLQMHGNGRMRITAYGIEMLEQNRFNVEPIPITPEILDKCGFSLYPWGYVKKSVNDFGIRLNLHTFSYDVSGNNPVKIKYLHQLQNLYFALTGEELNIKL